MTGARDERFKFILSNDSGCTGAAVARGKGGESISKIIERFGYWFCDNYRKYADNEDKMPFDQHFLLVSIAPRNVYVASGSKDLWADPQSEFLSCFAASEVYEKMGLKGFVCPDRFPETGEKFHEGNVGYHVRKGPHYFSREDWNLFLDYMEKHKVCEHNRDEMKIIAHRSGPTKYPEQTIQSAQLALENGADMIELDVRFTADKKIAVSHDKNVQRVFGVDKEVANMTAEEFLSLRHTENPAFSSHLFENYMKCGVAPILIHIKEDDIVDELLKCIDAYGYADKVVFGIQNVELVQKIKGHNKDMKIVAFMKKPENIADYGATDVDYIRLWEGWLNEKNINSVCKYNKALWIMTNGGEEVGVTTKENLNKIMDIGADGILINDITLCPKTAVLCLQ